ncbi:MAG: glycosyl transferase [Desulfobacterales bacterium]|jgi:predicted glycosyltransferase|nr:glycosyl transferase [Desulfobacterales bacterium]
MKIVYYCQHVLGVGHFFRSLEICRALCAHEVVLVTGGPAVAAEVPAHVAHVRLPELRMDAGFRKLKAPAGRSIEQVKRARSQSLLRLFKQRRPDLFLIELYPFGRRAFRFEIDPVLEAIGAGDLPACRVVCSLRDILVEKDRPAEREAWTVEVLNRHFGAVLVHTDPALVALEETFGRCADIRIPVVTTGFVSPRPPPDARRRVRARMGLPESDALIVVSAGGGSVGFPLLEASMRAFALLPRGRSARMVVYTGPFMPAEEAVRLRGLAGGPLELRRFSTEFLAELAAADLSVSMGGYNTSMNLLAARVPALVWPFAQNREQRLRAERLAARGALQVIEDADLPPPRLAAAMERMLALRSRPAVDIDLNGAVNTARWIDTWCAAG